MTTPLLKKMAGQVGASRRPCIRGMDKPGIYALIEFPYLLDRGCMSGTAHLRHWTLWPKRHLQGYNVLYPIGWDAFGLPTENYAIKNHIHPAIVTKKKM